MIELLISLWLVQISICQSTRIVQRVDTIGDVHRARNLLASAENSNNDTASLDERHRHWIEYFAKVIIFFLIFAACVILVMIGLYLALCCYSWTRPSRVRQDISIEHLTSNEMIQYADVSPTPSSGAEEHTSIEQG